MEPNLTQKKNFNYKYYSCLDSKLTSPQPEQHYIINKKAEKENGQIVFYGSEEFSVFEHQPYIYEKVKRTKFIDGVIFFTLDQFCYADKFNFNLLKNFLDNKKTIHFAREDISLYSFNDLDYNLPLFISYQNTFSKRNIIAKNILEIL